MPLILERLEDESVIVTHEASGDVMTIWVRDIKPGLPGRSPGNGLSGRRATPGRLNLAFDDRDRNFAIERPERLARLAETRVGRADDRRASQPIQPCQSSPPPPPSHSIERRIKDHLVTHLGSANAADVWLNSPRTGYPTTAMDAIRAGDGELVLADLEGRASASPAYS